MTAAYAWARRLPDAAVFEILDGLHDMLAGGLRKALLDEVWRRYSYPLHNWMKSDHADGVVVVCRQLVNRLDADEHPERSGAFQDRAKAVSLTGHAPGRVIRTDGVFATYAGQFSCTCGWRADSAYAGGQVRVGLPTWPRKGAWLTVCPRAPSPSAPLHAPQAGWAGAFTRCICGWDCAGSSLLPARVRVKGVR